MPTPRERFLQALDFQPADPPFVRWGAEYAWEETLDLWRQQGWDGRLLEEVFGADRIVRVDPYYGPAPDFAYEVVAEDERTRTFINHEGILMRELKKHRDTSMPQFLKFPVANESDFERLAAERLELNAEARFTDQWQQRVQDLRNSPGRANAGPIAGVASSGRCATCWAWRNCARSFMMTRPLWKR